MLGMLGLGKIEADLNSPSSTQLSLQIMLKSAIQDNNECNWHRILYSNLATVRNHKNQKKLHLQVENKSVCTYITFL